MECCSNFTALMPIDSLCSITSNGFCFGCYELLESQKKRRGALYYGNLIITNSDNDSLYEFQIEHPLFTDFGILDLKAIPQQRRRQPELSTGSSIERSTESNVLTVCSDNCVRLFQRREITVTLTPQKTEDQVLGLSLDVSCNRQSSNIFWSSSNGYVHYGLIEKPTQTTSLLAHPSQDPVWTIGLQKNQAENIFATGADDCALKIWDLRQPDPCHQNTRTHESGVTVVCFDGDASLLSGSYDEFLREWDLRNLASPLRAARLPGAPWRVQRVGSLLAIAATHGGCCVLDAASLEEVGRFTGHSSMVYGLAALTITDPKVNEKVGPKTDSKSDLEGDLEVAEKEESGVESDLGSLWFVSGSFYDRKLSSWRLAERR